MIRRATLLLAALGLITACDTVNYHEVSRNGEFSGSLFVMWVGPSDTSLGDGKFVFVPNPDNRLSFTRIASDGTRGATYSPEMMYTDGGSIPRIASAFNGFQPWGYAPAYMIHDWLFVARNCLRDEEETPDLVTDEMRKVATLRFQDSATIIAEAIRALQESGRVPADDISGAVISNTVAGPISRRAWRQEGACLDRQVSKEDRAAAEAAFPLSVRNQKRIDLADFDRPLPDGTTEPVQPAILIGEFGFR